jgi:hypothetical protein
MIALGLTCDQVKINFPVGYQRVFCSSRPWPSYYSASIHELKKFVQQLKLNALEKDYFIRK